MRNKFDAFDGIVLAILGKTVLHPNVGFMWEIIDNMWDDPTFFNYHFGC